MTEFVMLEGLAEPADLRPVLLGECCWPVWVVLDEVLVVVSWSARFMEVRWVAKYWWVALVGDLGVALFGVSLVFVVRFGVQINLGYVLLGAALPIAWLACVVFEWGYETRYFGIGLEEFRSIIWVVVALIVVVVVTSYATKSQVACGFVVLVVSMTCFAAMFVRWLLHRQISKRWFLNRCMCWVLVVGRNDQVITLRRYLEECKTDGYVVVANCLPRGDAFEESGSERLGRAEMDILKVVDEWDVEVVVVVTDLEFAGHSLWKLFWVFEQRGVDLIVSLGIVEVAGPRISIRPVVGLSLLHLERLSVSGGLYVLKSIFDWVVGGLMVLALMLLLLITAIMVKVSSRGLVLFR